MRHSPLHGGIGMQRGAMPVFILSVRTFRSHLIGYAAAAAALAVTVALLALCPQGTAVPGAADAQRRAFLAELGYVLAPQPAQVQQVTVPAQADAAFLAYDRLQRSAGMTLDAVRGQTLQCYTYAVTNWPGEDRVQAHLYVWHGRIVAGDISAARADGFRRGLLPLQQTAPGG